MAVKPKQQKKCSKGHLYYKSTDCPVCLVCEQKRKPESGFITTLSAPARRALENKGILTLQQLTLYSKAEILSLHGMGPSTIPKLQSALNDIGLSFRP